MGISDQKIHGIGYGIWKIIMLIKKLGKSWWIISDEYGLIGPYNKREDATSDKKGILRFQRFEDADGFVSSTNAPIMTNDK